MLHAHGGMAEIETRKFARQLAKMGEKDLRGDAE